MILTDKLAIISSPTYAIPSRSLSECIFTDPGFPYKEELLQFIWGSQLFRSNGLRTTEGAAVQVIHPGIVQPNGGPDLTGAMLRIDGQLWAGNVEVHVRSSEWNTHGHQVDPAYDNVVLHVVFRHDQEVVTSKGERIPTVVLGPRIDPESLLTYQQLMHSRSWVPCSGQLERTDDRTTQAWLGRVLLERLERRSQHVNALFRNLGADPRAALYHLLAQAFGMKVNKDAFGMLAYALPLKIAMKYRDDPVRMEALVFGLAGMLQVDHVEDHPRHLQKEYHALSLLHGVTPVPLAAWKFSRMRPVNFPTVRLAQFAALLGRSDGDIGQLFEMDSIAELRKFLRVSPTAYWDDRHRFDQPSPKRSKRLGQDAADHVIINAVVPVLFTLGRALGRSHWRDRAVNLLGQLPAERNTVLEGWAQHGLRASSAAEGQALIELRTLYCEGRKCLLCGIGRQLLRSGRDQDRTEQGVEHDR